MSWILICERFFGCVKSEWKAQLNKCHGDEEFKIEDIVSASDEALIIWLIRCKMDKIKDKSNMKKQDSKAQIREYLEIYKVTKERRDDEQSRKYWNNIFWKHHKKNRNYLPIPKKARRTYNNDAIELPIDGDF